METSMSTANLLIARQVRPEQASEAPYAWVIVAIATTCLALGFGANIIISVFMKSLDDELSCADTSMAYTMNAIGARAGGILWGGLSRERNARSSPPPRRNRTDRAGGSWPGSCGRQRSAMAVQAAQDAGLKTACHIEGGIDAWRKASGPFVR